MLGKCIVAVCAIFALSTIFANCDCSIYLASTDFPKPTPVFLEKYNDLDWLIPGTNLMKTIKPGGQIVLACPGVLRSRSKEKPSNEFSGIRGRTVVRLKCIGTNFWDQVDNVRRDLSTLTCLGAVNAEVYNTQKRCASNKGRLLDVGFYIDRTNYDSYQVCYNTDTATTYYTTHIVHPAAVNSKEDPRSDDFRSDMTGLTVATLKRIYRNLLNILPRKYQDEARKANAFVARGHLVPDADFTFKYRRDATLFYINVGPKFQSINAGHWKSVEEWVRKTAAKWNTELLIHTGYVGVLTLKDEFGVSRQMYLNANDPQKKFPIPEFFFKIVQHTDSESGIVFVTYNNPFVTSYFDVPSNMCVDVCAQANIVDTIFYRNRDNFKSGFTRCCTLEDFGKMYPAILPDSVCASKLLVDGPSRPQADRPKRKCRPAS